MYVVHYFGTRILYIYWHKTMCVSAGRGNENEHLASRLNSY